MEIETLNNKLEKEIEEILKKEHIPYTNLLYGNSNIEELEFYFVINNTTYKMYSENNFYVNQSQSSYENEGSFITILFNRMIPQGGSAKTDYSKMGILIRTVYNFDDINQLIQEITKEIRRLKIKNIFEENELYHLTMMVNHPIIKSLKINNEKYLTFLKKKFAVKTNKELELELLRIVTLEELEELDEITLLNKRKNNGIKIKRTTLMKLV